MKIELEYSMHNEDGSRRVPAKLSLLPDALAKIDEQLAISLDIQADLCRLMTPPNCRFVPHVVRDPDQMLYALKRELDELVDELHWKWWNRGQPMIPNWQNILVELADMWAFACNWGVLRHPYSSERDKRLTTEGTLSFSRILGEPWPALEQMITALYRLLTDSALLHRHPHFHLGVLILDIAAKLGFTPTEVLDAYYCKSVLNTFRQLNGYKQGVYQKSWRGQEDNVYASAIWQTLSHVAPEQRPAELLKLLGEEYQLVTGTPAITEINYEACGSVA